MGAVDQMSFEELLQTFADFEQDREPSQVDQAVHRSAVERRLMELLSASPNVEKRAFVRVPGELQVKLRIADEQVRAEVRDLGEGGLRVFSRVAPPEGARIDVELITKQRPAHIHPPRAQVRVAWVSPRSEAGYEVGLAFVANDEAHRRRMRRLVVEMLRRLPRFF